MFSNANIVKGHLFRYQFASKFLSGRILDFQCNAFSSFHAAKLLLENGATEVIRCNLINNKTQYSRRKLTSQKSLEYEIIKENEINLLLGTFDAIISFETINTKNYDNRLSEFLRLIKDDGSIVISVYNQENENSEMLKSGFTYEEFVSILNSKFGDVSIYSQRLLTDQKPIQQIFPVLGKFRKIAALILSSIDKNKQFYIKKLQNKMQKINKLNYEIKKIPDSDFEIISYRKEHKPQYFIAVCKKVI